MRDELTFELDEAIETVQAIREGKVDAFFVSDHAGDQVLVLDGCDAPYRLLVEKMQQGAATVTRDGTIFFHNNRFLVLLGMDENVTGQNIMSLVSEKDRPALEQLIADGDAGGREIEVLFQRADGSELPTLLTLSPLRNPDALCLIFIDLSLQKKREHERVTLQWERNAREDAERTAAMLEATRAELEQRVAERTDALRKLALELTKTEQRERTRLAEILHNDVQQLLIALKTQATLAKKQPARMDQILPLIDQVIVACRELTLGLCTPLLHRSDLKTTIESYANQLQAHHGLATTLLAEDELPDLPEASRMILFEAARELLFNVIKHAESKSADVVLGVEAGNVYVEVRDQGLGCDPAKLLCDTSNSFGLFSIRDRLTAVGGRMSASSQVGEGTVIRITVPTSDRSLMQAENTQEQPGEQRVPRVQRIMVVDDHEIFRHALIRLLSSQGEFLIVGQASNGNAACELAKQVKPDTIVMDISMPIMNGIDAAGLIRAEMPEVRIVGLSMHDSDTMIQAFLSAGGDAFINKTELTENLFDALRCN
ncbi:MAG: response regulator [Candidatus Hydrogenedentes bacterium]|nr:response regulator [Candidatus Hydrogenedentota bacterium]